MKDEPQLPKGVFSEGADSYLHGVPLENCPYPPDSIERAEWFDGWNKTAATAT